MSCPVLNNARSNHKIQQSRANDIVDNGGKQFELGKSWCLDFFQIPVEDINPIINLVFKPLSEKHAHLSDYRIELGRRPIDYNKFNENVRKDKDGNLLVKCKYCNKWFTPTNESVLRYLRFDDGTNNLYCSEACKKSCPSYGVKKYERGFRRNTSREVQPELRKLVLERDNWTCQRCGKSKNDDIELVLHCHHIEPVKRNPVESADIDNCITLCKECHKEVHRIKGCRYTDLANCTREQK